jgi:hypothetical protein
MPNAPALPPLPPDAAESAYILAAVRGLLQWLPTTAGIPHRDGPDRAYLQTLWALAPAETGS